MHEHTQTALPRLCKRHKCTIRQLHFQSRGPVSTNADQFLVQELVKHLLYIRNQMPGLFEDLEWQIQEQQHQQQLQAENARAVRLELEEGNNGAQEQLTPLPTQNPKRKKRRLQTSQKRLCKFMNAAQDLLSHVVPQLFTSQQPFHVVIAFGSTASRPSEVYSLTFPASEQQTAEMSHKSMEDFARRVIRTLVVNTQDLPEGRASTGPTKVFLLVHGDFPDESIPVGFIFKRGFQIRMQKGLQVSIDLTGAAPEVNQTPSHLDAAAGEEDRLRWYQCKTVLKGLRAPGSGEVDRTG